MGRAKLIPGMGQAEQVERGGWSSWLAWSATPPIGWRGSGPRMSRGNIATDDELKGIANQFGAGAHGPFDDCHVVRFAQAYIGS